MTDPKKRKSLDDIIQDLTEISDDRESGPDRFRALKMLANMEGAQVNIPAPLKDGEIVSRLSVLMKAAGPDLCQVAFARAFRFPKKQRVSDAPQMATEDLPPEIIARAQRIRTLKQLYKEFPEIKRPGYLPGYPQGRSFEVKQEWVRRTAEKLYLDREQAQANLTAAEIQAQARTELEAGMDAAPPSNP
jgi:hypothetical protein